MKDILLAVAAFAGCICFRWLHQRKICQLISQDRVGKLHHAVGLVITLRDGWTICNMAVFFQLSYLLLVGQILAYFNSSAWWLFPIHGLILASGLWYRILVPSHGQLRQALLARQEVP